MVEFIKACYYVAFGFFNGIEIIGRLDNDNRCRCDGNDTIVKLRARVLRWIVIVRFGVFIVV